MQEDAEIAIERLDGAGAAAAVPALTEILRDAVANGASVGFMDFNTSADFERFWQGIAEQVVQRQRDFG